MDTQGLSIICAGLGEQIEDDNGALIGYSKSEYCLDNLKDLQRFLRRDNPQSRHVFKQICKWNIVARDLIPIIEFHQNDRNLVINAVKILVFLTMPIDSASDDVAQQIEYLWDLKAAVTRNVTIAVIVSLLEDPLEHLEGNSFAEDDWKLVQLVLTLFRNILAIQGITLQQKASGSATQFLCLTDKFLELMFQENVMDLILALTQHVDDPCGYLHQDSLLLLEIFHHIFQGRDPELIGRSYKDGTKADGDITTSVESLRSIMEEEEERRRLIRQRNLERHSQFSGTFTRLAVDGSKTLFKGNPASASGDSLLKNHKVPRGPLKRIAWDHGSLLLPKENILELLHNFLNQFLSGGYNVLMQSIRDDIKKEHQDIQNSDVIVFFQVAQFVIAFQRQKVLNMQKQHIKDGPSEATLNGRLVDNLSFHGDLCGPIAATINEAMFFLVISKWREAFEGLKETKDHQSLSAAGSLMKNMMHMLDLVLKLLPEDSKEPQTARILLYKLFYDQTDQGLTQFLLNLFRCFDNHKQPKSDLADLLEVIHIVLRLMEKLQVHGTLRVARKSRKGRTKKGSDKKGSDRLKDEHSSPHNDIDKINEAEKPPCEPFVDTNKINSDLLDSTSAQKEGTSTSNQALDPEMPAEATLYNVSSIDGDKEKNPNDLTCDTEDSADGDQLPSTSEADFNVTKLVLSFANNAVIQNLCWLLKYYRSNSASTNHYIICMLRRFCDDLELSPMLYQLSLLTTFYEILSDRKSSHSKDYANIVHFITKFVRKMMKIMKCQPLLFVEILFWKTRKECHYINAEALMGDLVHLKKDIKNLDNERSAFSNSKGAGYINIADSLGDDEVDNVVPHIFNDQGEEKLSDTTHDDNTQKRQSEDKGNINILTDEMDFDDSENISSDLPTQRTSRMRKSSIFDAGQETAIRHLYEKYKDHQRCSRLIAEALDPDGNVSAVQVSCKLRQLGLKVASRKTMASSGVQTPAEENTAEVVLNTSSTGATPHSSNEPDDGSYLKTSRRRKRICAFSKEQELEIKDLFERFKNQKKCSQLIANALGADNTYTAAQVSRKLRQLELLAPQGKKALKSAKQSDDKETVVRGDQSDEETLVAIKKSRRRNRICAFSKEQELEIKDLFERFKNQKKCSQLIANALGADNTYTAAQVSHKLRQLGLLAPQGKKALKSAKQSDDKETVVRGDQSDEETLVAIKKRSKRKKSKPLMQEGMATSISQQDGDDETLSAMFKDVLARQRESDPARKNGDETAAYVALADNIETDMDSACKREDVDVYISHEQEDETHDEQMIDLEDSGDDLGTVVPRKIGSRRSLKMVIDADDDE